MAFAQRGHNNKPVETKNLFASLLDEDKKPKKKKEKKIVVKEPEPLKSLSPMPNSSMNWADCADSDEEDMFGESPGNWGDMADEAPRQETPCEAEEADEEADDEVQEEEEEEDDVAEVTLRSRVAAPVVEEKQLSKKELKRIEMEELDRALEEMGMQGTAEASTTETPILEASDAESPAKSEASKKARKRGGKKKNAPAAEETPVASTGAMPTLDPELKGSVDSNGSLDPDAVAKLIAAKHGNKKKSSESSGASAAAKEAAARKERAKKDKKKSNKSNYNQQPTR
jgi:hypothetical protein